MKSLQIFRKFCLGPNKPKNEVFCSLPPPDILGKREFLSQNGEIWFSVQFLPLRFHKNSLQNVLKHSGNCNFHLNSSKIQSLGLFHRAKYSLSAFLIPTQSWVVNPGRDTFKGHPPHVYTTKNCNEFQKSNRCPSTFRTTFFLHYVNTKFKMCQHKSGLVVSRKDAQGWDNFIPLLRNRC